MLSLLVIAGDHRTGEMRFKIWGKCAIFQFTKHRRGFSGNLVKISINFHLIPIDNPSMFSELKIADFPKILAPKVLLDTKVVGLFKS